MKHGCEFTEQQLRDRLQSNLDEGYLYYLAKGWQDLLERQGMDSIIHSEQFQKGLLRIIEQGKFRFLRDWQAMGAVFTVDMVTRRSTELPISADDAEVLIDLGIVEFSEQQLRDRLQLPSLATHLIAGICLPQ